jgi:hypothetical protein
VNPNLPVVVGKLQGCPNFRTLYALEKTFNQVGLTIQHTPQNWMVLCRIEEGRPVAAEVLEDFVFMGRLEDQGKPLPPELRESLINFVENAAGNAAFVSDKGRVWKDGVQIYDKTLFVVNEEVKKIAQTLMD